MGVNWRHYILCGIKTNYKQVEDIDNTGSECINELQIVRDEMNGEYGFVGIPLFISEDGRYEQADIPLFEIPLITDDMKNKITAYAKNFNIDGEIKIYVFTYYS